MKMNEFKTNQKFDFTIIENALSGFKIQKKYLINY